MNKLVVLIAPLSLLACGAEPPVTHAVSVQQRSGCGSCEPTSTTEAEGVVFETEEGRLALFTDFPVAGGPTAMLEIVGLGEASAEVRYHELADGRIAFDGVVDRATVDVQRLADGARVEGTVSLDVHDGEVARSYPEIRVRPSDTAASRGSGGGGSSGGGSSGSGGQGSGSGGGHGGHGGGTSVIVIVDPPVQTYVDSGGCEGDTAADSGGCESDTTSSDAGGCEGDTGSDSGGCESDSSSSAGGCEGDTASSASSASCEGDVAARSGAVPGLFRLLWPIVVAGVWNRLQRRRVAALRP